MSEKNIKHNSKQGLKRNAMLWLLVLTSSVLLSIPFLYPHLGLVALVAFIPLFAAEHIATEIKKRHFWLHYYVAFLVWNVFTTSWIYYATLPGMIAAVTLNALQMAVIFRLFRWVKTLSKGFLPYLFFITTWLAWEHAYFNWDVSWPWLVLGNSFSTSIKCIQWYEYTGALGGSLWVLLVNALAFRLIRLVIDKKRYIISAGSLALLIVLPLTLSLVIYYTYKEQAFEPSIGDGSRKFTVLQPNILHYFKKSMQS